MEPPESAPAARSVSGRVPAADSSLVLVLRAQEGDERAKDELCARYLPRLRRWARGRLPGWAREHLDTEDIVQETLVRSISQLDGFSPTHEHAFWAYTCQALRNRLRDVVRRAHRRPAPDELSEEQIADDPSPLELAVGRDTLRRYESALQRLRPMDRELIIAKVELGFEYSEITELLGKASIGATRVAVSRALIRLAEEMGIERQA
ncbi:MAG TPA: sigma-70 family RNA polymerase sigma factor [Methylomirabilota bacterium]|jgi:RNA polymerase sigma-70 factor (ECF subfamily)